MQRINWTRFGLYHLRWQLSTPILASVGIFFAAWGITNFWISAAIANVIGASIFFFIDRIIFQSPKLDAQWEVVENVQCVDCGVTARGYRLVKTRNYDRTKDTGPQYRCEICSSQKTQRLRERGVEIS